MSVKVVLEFGSIADALAALSGYQVKGRVIDNSCSFPIPPITEVEVPGQTLEIGQPIRKAGRPPKKTEPVSAVTEVPVTAPVPGPAVTKEQVIIALKALNQALGMSRALEALAKFNAKMVGELKEKDYHAFVEHCNEVAAAPKTEAAALEISPFE